MANEELGTEGMHGQEYSSTENKEGISTGSLSLSGRRIMERRATGESSAQACSNTKYDREKTGLDVDHDLDMSIDRDECKSTNAGLNLRDRER